MLSSQKKFLVTGITGFLGSSMAKLLLENNYQVRGTVRSKSNAKKLHPLKCLPNSANLELVEANLLNEESWPAAINGCNYIMHIASPFPSKYPKTEEEIIRPAVNGTLNVLKAAYENKVEHVVLTSSIAAVQSIGKSAKKFYTEEDWADLSNATPYYKSKAMAEKAAWNYYYSLPKESRFKLTTILPGVILGPALVTTDFASGEIVKQLLTGSMIVIPKINYGIVDVRDVTLAHLRAVERGDKTDGERFICCTSSNLWFEEIADILRKEFGKYGYNVCKWKAKYYPMKLASIFSPQAKTLLPFWGLYQQYSNDKIKQVMEINFRSAEESIIDMAYSMIENKVVPDYIKKTKL